MVRGTPAGAGITVANALLFTFSRWESLGGPALLLWCAGVLLISGVVLRGSFRIRERQINTVSRRGQRKLLLTSFVQALPWGVLALWVVPAGSDFDRLITLVLCAGMMTGAAMMLQRTLAAALVFLGTINFCVFIGCVMTGLPEMGVLVAYDLLCSAYIFYSGFMAGQTARERDRSLARLSEANRRLEAAYTQISEFAYVDALTRLANRKAFVERLEEALSERTFIQSGYAVFLFDLDHFKNINDTLGHVAGDELLSVTGGRIRKVIGEAGLVARLGGDEFAVLVATTEHQIDVSELAARLVEAIAEPLEIAGRRVFPGSSIGIAFLRDRREHTHEILQKADHALQSAKEQGRGKWTIFDEVLGRKLQDSNLIAVDLKHALENGEIEVHYHPKVALDTGLLHGAEALVRWRHPRLGNVPPDRFLPVAAERALMQQLSACIFARVGRDVLDWRAAGVAFGKVAINIHPVDLKSPDHLMGMIRALSDQGVGPEDVLFEVTEGCFVGRGTDQAALILDAIADLGYELSLDDFGTGHAALSHLKSLPVCEIKIDRSFVSRIAEAANDRAITEATLAIARGMGLRSVAEGIETISQLDIVRALGADIGQGYLWSRPINARDMEAFARRNAAGVRTGNVPPASSGAISA